MSIDTRGKLLGKVEPEVILDFIKEHYDKNATMNIKTTNMKDKCSDVIKERYGNTNDWVMNSGFISFKENSGDTRCLFYNYSNANFYENLDYYSVHGLESMVKSEVTDISLGYSGESIEIIKSIVTEFGGWVDENDCDEIPFYPIGAKATRKTKPVIYITREELNNKFGGIVVIRD